MKVFFRNTDDTALGVAVAMDATAGVDDDRLIKKIVVGKPVAGGVITIWGMNNALTSDTANKVFEYTFPTFAAGTPASDQFDFASVGTGDAKRDGLPVNGGGSITTVPAMQVTVLLDNPDA